MSADRLSQMKFGKLRIKCPVDILPGSHIKKEWVCDCGKIHLAAVYSVLSGDIKSCGKCNLISSDQIKGMKFGKLRIKEPVDILPGSIKKVEWVCDCGRTTSATPDNVFYGNIKSCGKCFGVAKDWYSVNKSKIRSLVCPVHPDAFPVGGPTPLETIRGAATPFEAACPSCGKIYHPRLGDVRLGISITCGCTYDRTSAGQSEVAEFIRSTGLHAELEYDIDGLKYDVYIPKANLLIEYNGIKWHSMDGSRKRDLRKYEVAQKGGYGFLSLFSDEWKFGRTKVESLIRGRLGVMNSDTLRPSQCEIRPVPSQEADLFYERFHYIGPCRPKASYGGFLKDKLIACMSFSRPTRQSSHPWELVRMASDPEFRVHGIWSKLFKRFVKEHEPKSVVSFSDNRLFSGGVYERMGFKLDGEVVPDYYWVKGGRRFHKSALRKTREERKSGKTEAQLREAQGYRKIWDLGKKRWVFTFESG